ncbi:hypothetical protein BGW36DRAFT_415370 [Talaromyces proteolyticus]|uniref:NAD(P)-binding protein n=1 Tax=Talaromyces proteolyticus TaxID=1131652 RepID=A0AAD4KVZ9_9EURO|nr:uncharacterized protein BGW36DRAFT_415370 [Talaromyces proteolyticus]KAH8700247.1 hypothetical protein BGW36DRAFT_415370 [Talaromyces proteolyticus]
MASNLIVFITGANTGLGLETVKSLLQSPTAYTILLGGRSLEKANTAAKEVQAEFIKSPSIIKTVQIDLEDDGSISSAYEHITKEYGRVDVLINNGGGQFDQQILLGNMSMREAWNKSWNVNVTGTCILTHTFVPLLLKAADPRLIFITSGVSTLAESDNIAIKINHAPAKGWPKKEPSVVAYRSSKTGMNMMMREWTRILKEDGVKVWAISPGFLATGLGGNPELNKKMGALNPSIGASLVREVVEGARDLDTGKVVRRDGIQPW